MDDLLNHLQTLRALGASLDVPPDEHVADIRARVLTSLPPTPTSLLGRDRLSDGRTARAYRLPAPPRGGRWARGGRRRGRRRRRARLVTRRRPIRRCPVRRQGGRDGAAVLRLAARAVTAAPGLELRPDQFVYTESVTVQRLDIGPVVSGAPDPGPIVVTPGLGPATTVRQQEWRSVDGSREGLIRSAGGPDVRLPGCASGGRDDRRAAVPGRAGPRPELPADAVAILALLRERYAGVNEFTAAGLLLARGYVPPATRAVLFEALASLDGVVVLDDLTDAAGRHGVAVTRTNGGFRARSIFDPASHALLGSRTDVIAGNAWNWAVGATPYATALRPDSGRRPGRILAQRRGSGLVRSGLPGYRPKPAGSHRRTRPGTSGGPRA